MSAGNWKEMFQAACDGDMGLVQYHVDMGVDINYAHPELQATPLVACILARQAAVALFLLDHGADTYALSEFDGLTPMQAATQTGLDVVIEKLRALGA
jgi:ankyrin repeat protein